MTLMQELIENGCYLVVPDPVYVAATIEGVCNLRCKHCYWSHDTRNIPVVDDWSEQIAQLVAWGSEVAYAGRILSPRGAAFIENYCRSSGKKIGIVDNGFTIQKYPELMQYYEYINISVDGVAEDHDKQRGMKGSCAIAWEAIHNLKFKGYDPIISCCVSPVNFGSWDRFENMVCKRDVRLSCTPVLPVLGNRNRMPFFSDTELCDVFEKLVHGCGKLIKLVLPEHVQTLMPILKEYVWEIHDYSLEAEVEGIYISYQPLSIDTLVGRNLSWNGKFYVNADADDSRFGHVATNERVLEVANGYAKKEYKLVRELLR